MIGDPVADARRDDDDRWVAELAPQAADGHRDGVGERVGVLVPGLFEQALGAEEGRRGADERFEDRELLDRKVQLPPIAGGRAPQRVKLDPGRAQDPAPGGRLAARERTDARASGSRGAGSGNRAIWAR